MKPNKGARFDAFMKMSYGQAAQELPSNEEIRRRNLEEYKRDLAAEEKAVADAAALAARTAEEKELGISDTMSAIRAHDAREAERLQRVWSRPFENLAAHAEDRGENAIDVFHTMVLTDTPCERSPEEVVKASDAFFVTLEEEGITLSEDDKRRILVYVGLNGVGLADKNIFIDPMAMGTWRGALSRLTELGAIKPVRQSTPQPKRAEISDRTTKAQDEQILGEQFVGEAGSWINAWSDSVRQNFGIVMTTDQKRKALDYIVNVLDGQWNQHSSWDKARRHLARTGVLVCADGTLPLTQKEIIEETMDKLRLDVPAERQEYLKLANYLNHNEI